MKLANPEPTQDVGIIIGRFQLDKPHEAHLDLIDSVARYHQKLIIILGLSPLKGMKQNPLDYDSRRKMLETALATKYPNVLVLYCKDTKYNDIWSRRIDALIKDNIGANHTVALYGSRDSFINSYTTKTFPVYELKPETTISATEIRNNISKVVINSDNFRSGVIYITQQQPDMCISYVHVAIFNEDKTEILLGKKVDERAYGIIGGVMNPKLGGTGEQQAKHVLSEQIGIFETSPFEYVCSEIFNDWQYRTEISKPFTTLFETKKLWGSFSEMKEYTELKWFPVSDKLTDMVEPEFKPLIEKLLKQCFH